MPSPVAYNPVKDSPEYQAFTAFARLTSEKRDLAAQLADVESRLRTLETQLLSYLGENGYEKVRVEGYTLSAHREPWVYPKQGIPRTAVCQALKECGLGHYVSEQFNTRSLTKYIRDLENEERELLDSGGNILEVLPAELARVIEVKPAFRIQALRR